MAGRRPQGPPPIQPRQFIPEEVESGIRKLRRRIEEVEALDPQHVRYNDEAVLNAERNIRATILEVFGQNSPEFRDHEYHEINQGYVVARGYGEHDDTGAQRQRNFAAGKPQTLKMLANLVKRLEEKREDLGVDTTARVRASFEGLELHPRIASASADLYRDGHYRNAVGRCLHRLVNYVKEKSRRHDLDGSGLMSTVFSKNKPVLAFNDLKDQRDADEQEA